jgi:hypothetical protein
LDNSTRVPTAWIFDALAKILIALARAESVLPDTEAKVVVPVVGGVPLAVGRAEVLWIVVPRTAADDAATRGCPGFKGYGKDQTGRPGRSHGASATYLHV